ncbi:hypothetical protein CI109_100914 [Kwoniella shandongensis]|uniref:Uncharacterized protein n=1 Tax=Kwoniella shandongensis TaxID=1734106 RepID=A0A5M6C4E9_9TREE|nr:uncharacterized protein CI109_001380 [Kwoniella shandongensis]KAA5529978.1 hypothetical protein CI109_001380 [Kwoniella shandongensis]
MSIATTIASVDKAIRKAGSEAPLTAVEMQKYFKTLIDQASRIGPLHQPSFTNIKAWIFADSVDSCQEVLSGASCADTFPEALTAVKSIARVVPSCTSERNHLEEFLQEVDSEVTYEEFGPDCNQPRLGMDVLEAEWKARVSDEGVKWLLLSAINLEQLRKRVSILDLKKLEPEMNSIWLKATDALSVLDQGKTATICDSLRSLERTSIALSNYQPLARKYEEWERKAYNEQDEQAAKSYEIRKIWDIYGIRVTLTSSHE